MVTQITMMDRDEYLASVRSESESQQPEQPEYKNVIDDEIAELHEAISQLQAAIAIKEEELHALIVRTLSGNKE
jgi:exopolysaccharide biosynthesis predicted pyruvyltransferase EpsI